MKKRKIFLLGVVLSMTMACGAAACSKPGDNGNNPSPIEQPSDIKFAKDYYTLEQFTSDILVVPDFAGKTVVYTSSDPNVATIDENGLLYALTVGQTTITAECGEEKAICTVNVTKAKYSPLLVLEHDNVSLNVGDTFSMDVYTTYNNEVLSEDTEYSVTLADGAAENVAEVSVAGGRVIINALSAGETEYYVSATVRGKYLNQKLTIKVLPDELKIKSLMDDMEMGENGYLITLATIRGDFGATEHALLFDVYKGRQKIEDAAVTWTSGNENIAAIEEKDGVSYVSAVKGGTTVLTGNYTDGEQSASVSITVNVIKPIVALESDDVPVISAYGAKEHPEIKQLSVDGSLVEGAFVQAIFNGKTVSVSSEVKDGKINITLNGEAFPKKADQLGEKTMLIETEIARYEMNVKVYSLVVENEQDLLKIAEIESEQNGNGYFVLGRDITMSGNAGDWYATDRNNAVTVNRVIGFDHDFVGIIDGNGHKINGFAVKHWQTGVGFIKQLGAGGVLRNIAFTDTVFGQKGGMVQNGNGGTIENVYIGIKTYDSDGQNNHGLFGPSYDRYALTMRNVIVDYANADIKGILNSSNVNLFGSFSDKTSFTNVAVTGVPSELSAYMGNIGNSQGSVYVSYSAGTDNGVALPDGGWDSQYWVEEEGSLPVFKGISKKDSLTVDGGTVNLNVSVADGAATAGNAVTINLGTEIGNFTNAIVTLGGATYEGSVTNGGLTFNAPATVWGNQTFTVTCTNDTTEYTIIINALFVTKYIANEEDLQNISVIETALDGKGYYMLANNITMSGSSRTWFWYGDINHIIGYNHAFTGTIDGNGYRVTGFALEYADVHGFINQFGEGGTLKNIAFVDMVLTNKGGFIANSTGGTLENVYLGIKTFDNVDQNNHGLFGPTYTTNTFTMKNVVIDYTGAEINVDGKANTTILGSFSGGSKFENVVVKGVPVAYKATDYEGKGLTNSDGSYKMYISYSDGTDNGTEMPVNGWNTEYWTVNTADKIITWKQK